VTRQAPGLMRAKNVEACADLGALSLPARSRRHVTGRGVPAAEHRLSSVTVGPVRTVTPVTPSF